MTASLFLWAELTDRQVQGPPIGILILRKGSLGTRSACPDTRRCPLPFNWGSQSGDRGSAHGTPKHEATSPYAALPSHFTYHESRIGMSGIDNAWAGSSH